MSIGDLLENNSDYNSTGSTRTPHIHGIMLGVVTENSDDEHKGMVKVEIVSRDDKKNITNWARVASSYGGKSYGFYTLPEVGDEVLVAFLEGSIERPYIISTVYKEEGEYHKEAYHKDNYIKKFKTKGGIEVIFNDEKDKQDITIKTAAGHKINLNDEKKIISISESKGKNIIEINADKGEITVKSEKVLNLKSDSVGISIDGNSKKIKIEADTVEIEGSKKTTVKSQGLKLEGQSLDINGQNLNIKGGAQLNIKGDGILKIEGAMVKLN